MTFFPNQRYTSEGEPELGVGILKETSKGRIEMYFPIPNETRLYASENAPLRRVTFKPGDTIIDSNKQELVIERIEQKAGLFIYFGKEGTISEADLGDVSVNHGVVDRLSMGEVDSPALFSLRRETLLNDQRRRTSPVNGFVGGRIDLIPHQLYIAHEVSRRYAPRVLLSDQVGLGKTIEACLILHRLLLSGRISRVMILVPESLVHQWFVEVLRRFNLWFNIFDEERCSSLDDNAPDGNPFLDDQLIICSIEFLASSEKRARQAISASWDMLVVDEAHHLEWSVEKASPEYSIVELLSKVANGLLLLTATPEQLGLESHFARLRLLDPERYSNYDDFIKETNDHKDTSIVLREIETLLKKEDISKNNIIEDLLDQHGPGRVLFRNTRSTIKGFPKRKAHIIPLKAPKVDWLLKTMKKLSPAKVLLVCKSKEMVLALAETLSKHPYLKTSIFHEDLTIVQRDRNAAWFSESDGARLLLCSEIGSEGRNFQFAHHLILYDLPDHPELLEQRIGRLDRIGQTEDVHIHIPYLENSHENVKVRWFHEGLNAFEENLEGGSKIYKLFREQLLRLSKPDAPSEIEHQLDTLITDTKVFHEELKATLAKGRDKLLEMNSYRPAVAQKLIQQIQMEDQDQSLESYMTKVFEHFNVEMEDLAPRTYLLHPSNTNTELFPSITHEGRSVTFDRKRALSREDISFLSWDHPLITNAIDMVLSTGTGSASFGVLRGAQSPGLLLEVLFVLETAGEQSIYVDRFLPNTSLRIVIDHRGSDVTDKYPIESFDKQLIPSNIDDLLENETFMDRILPHMIAEATQAAEEFGANTISDGLERMNHTLDHEINRLKTLAQKNKDIRQEEIHIAKKEQLTLTRLINEARIRMDALLLIMKG